MNKIYRRIKYKIKKRKENNFQGKSAIYLKFLDFINIQKKNIINLLKF